MKFRINKEDEKNIKLGNINCLEPEVEVVAEDIDPESKEETEVFPSQII